ncbi:MAG TPA: ATP-dependent DNA helicase [Gemmatimonadaceae bacterium]|nr:ATP-dependent DNA helicase [Gemmatimonadaceae bacterium]
MARALTAPQLEAVTHPSRRLRVLACAGSGKTEVLARRAVRLLCEGVPPSAIVAFTFTEKAALELKARIETCAAEADARFDQLPPCGSGMFIGTVHGWALRMLRELGGAYEMADALPAEREWVLLHRMARRLGIVDLYAAAEHRESAKVAASRAIDAFRRSMEVVYNDLVDRDVLRARAPRFSRVLERYEWLLREMRLMPFRLMISAALDELKPAGRLQQCLAGRITHVLVDEFQDFNRAQDALVGRLLDMGAALTVVGDDDQAIYQWRGGDVSLFLSFAERYQDTHMVPLPENHRSRPQIVSFAHALLRPLAERAGKALVSARALAPDGGVEVLVAATADQEAEHIAQRIATLIERGHRPRDIAVLYRSVRTSARPLVEALRQRAIPAMVVGKTSLLAHPEMALIARIMVYWAGGSWYPGGDLTVEIVTREMLADEIQNVTGADPGRAARMLEALEQMGERVRAEGVFDSIALYYEILATLELPGAGDGARLREQGLGHIAALFTDFDHAARRAAPAELYGSAITGASADEAAEDTAIVAALRAPDGAPAADASLTSAPPSASVRRLGATHGEIYLLRMRAFLEQFAGRAAEDLPDDGAQQVNAVQLMTVHQSKGLEFPVVFVPCLVEGRFPSQRMGRAQLWYVPDDLFDRARYEGREEDEARLLYVALTRARELLVVSWFANHARQKARPSRFLRCALRETLRDAARFGTVRPAPGAEHSATAGAEDLLDITFSRLVTYHACPYRYWLQYLCGFRPPLAMELGFGTLLHHLIAELAREGRAGQRPTDADVDRILDASFYLPFAGPVPAARLRDAARRRVKGYVRHYGDELLRTVQPEVRFEVPIVKARISGRIDLLMHAAAGATNEVELVDFKTSANRPPSALHENQLRLYAAAAERQGLVPVSLAIHDLDSDDDPRGDRIPVAYDDAARTAFVNELGGWVDGIRNGRFEPVADAAVCQACDFCRFCAHAPASAQR